MDFAIDAAMDALPHGGNHEQDFDFSTLSRELCRLVFDLGGSGLRSTHRNRCHFDRSSHVLALFRLVSAQRVHALDLGDVQGEPR